MIRRCLIAWLVGGTWLGHASAEERPFGLSQRVHWITSRVVGSPEPPPPYQAVRVFPNLTFTNPVYVAQEPGTHRLFVAQLDGKILAFPKSDPRPEARTVVLDTGKELYAFIFHRDYARNGILFTLREDRVREKPTKEIWVRVDRHRPEGNSRTYDGSRQEMIVRWPGGGHSGGEAIFGPDGYFYISTGDGSTGSDVHGTGQGVNDLLSVILRIDVDQPGPNAPYSIPKDNPFVDYPGARPEVWAHGFRNPWRMSFDPRTSKLLVGDVGQDLWEMIWLVEPGGNYGWSVQEGSHPFHPNSPQGPGPIQPPLVEHHHSVCRSITGGYVYDGPKFPELKGVYFYGDYEYGKIWGLRHDDKKVTWHQELADTPLRIPSFAVGRDGEIYIIDHLTGELYELAGAPEAPADLVFPRALSETGLFTSVAGHQVAPGVLNYSVIAPQWIDGAQKERFLALPDNGTIQFVETSSDANSWGFPDGTVTFETLSLPQVAGGAVAPRRIETRLMVRQFNHWLGYSYLWNGEQTDAHLVEAEGRDLVLTVPDPSAPGGHRPQSWRIPSRDECMVCHSRAAAFVLGLRTIQMNRDHDFGGTIDNQLRAWNHIGLFTEPLPKRPQEYAALADPYDDNMPIDSRARAYLHVNCSVCHVADGGGNAKLSLTSDKELGQTGLVNTTPLHGDFGLAGAHIVTPGDPFASVLFYRLSKVGPGRMPHVGSKQTDVRGLDVFRDWIAQLPEGGNPPRGVADYQTVVAELRNAGSEEDLSRRIDTLLATSRGAFLLSRIIENEASLQSVRSPAIAKGIASASPHVRDLFERFIPEQQRTQRLGEQFDSQALLAIQGDRERGRQWFLSASASQCRQCHKVGDAGGALGPELTGIAEKVSRAELLESLVAPARKIDPKYATHVVSTTTGEIHTGILVEKNDRETVLSVLKQGASELVRIPADETDAIVVQKTSLMPDGLLRDLTPQQAADLLEFLASLR